MPFSLSSQLSCIMGYIEGKQPKSLLDVGVGMGQYGFLSRTNLEHFNLYEVTGSSARRKSKEEWNIIIDGIEAYPAYITPVHDYAYNKIFESDALAVLPRIEKKYDMVLAIDILEHFVKADGLQFIKLLKAVSQGQVIVSTPKDFIEQHVEANPYENHRSHWSQEELKTEGFEAFLDNPDNWVAIWDAKVDLHQIEAVDKNGLQEPL